MRSGSPDHVLLKRGDSWTETPVSWGKCGRSQQEPALLGAYGSGARPMIKAGSGTAIDIVGGQRQQPRHPGRAPVRPHPRPRRRRLRPRRQGGYGIRFVAGTTGVLIEDCVIDQFGFNMLFQPYNSTQSNVKLRRNVITDAYSIGGHASGMYVQGVNGLTLEENVFDHNGWNEKVSGGGATPQNHNAYLSEKQQQRRRQRQRLRRRLQPRPADPRRRRRREQPVPAQPDPHELRPRQRQPAQAGRRHGDGQRQRVPREPHDRRRRPRVGRRARQHQAGDRPRQHLQRRHRRPDGRDLASAPAPT